MLLLTRNAKDEQGRWWNVKMFVILLFPRIPMHNESKQQHFKNIFVAIVIWYPLTHWDYLFRILRKCPFGVFVINDFLFCYICLYFVRLLGTSIFISDIAECMNVCIKYEWIYYINWALLSSIACVVFKRNLYFLLNFLCLRENCCKAVSSTI